MSVIKTVVGDLYYSLLSVLILVFSLGIAARHLYLKQQRKRDWQRAILESQRLNALLAIASQNGILMPYTSPDDEIFNTAIIEQIVQMANMPFMSDIDILNCAVALSDRMIKESNSTYRQDVKSNCVYFAGFEAIDFIKCAVNPTGNCSECLSFKPRR